MPHYEFFRHGCQNFFDKIPLPITGKVRLCVHIAAARTFEQRWSAFSAITSKKSA